MFNKTDKNVNELINLLMTTNEDKKVSMYAAIAMHVLNNDETVKLYVKGNVAEGIYKSRVRNKAYALNTIAVVEVDLLTSVINKVVEAKKSAMVIDGPVRGSHDVTDIIGVGNVMGEYLNVINNNFESFRKVYNLLLKINVMEGMNHADAENQVRRA